MIKMNEVFETSSIEHLRGMKVRNIEIYEREESVGLCLDIDFVDEEGKIHYFMVNEDGSYLYGIQEENNEKFNLINTLRVLIEDLNKRCLAASAGTNCKPIQYSIEDQYGEFELAFTTDDDFYSFCNINDIKSVTVTESGDILLDEKIIDGKWCLGLTGPEPYTPEM